LLKIFASGGISSASRLRTCPFSLLEMHRVVEVAHEHGIPVAAHAIAGPGIDRAIQAGVDTIEHASLLTISQLEAIVAADRAVVGTFSILFHPRGIEAEAAGNPEMRRKLDRYRPPIEECWRAIVRSPVQIALGTDSVHGAMPFEVETLIRLGATPERALQAATSAAARVCRLPDRGLIKPGYRAYLLVVDGDLEKDISALRRPSEWRLVNRE
jgi:imidazolonepropionase-like amidohydrolase